MSKGTNIVLIVILSILAFLITAGMVLGIIFYQRNDFSWTDGFVLLEQDKKKEEKFDSTQIDTISFLGSNLDLLIYETEEDQIRVAQYSKNDLEETELFRTEVENGVLKIDGTKGRNRICFFCIVNSSVEYKIYLPKNYQKKLQIENTSGDVTIQDNLKLSDLKIKVSSGDIELKDAEIGSLELFSSSGDLEMGSIRSKNINLSSTSGDIDGTSLLGDMKVYSTSGDIDFNQFEGKGSVSSTSGDIQIRNYLVTGDTAFESTSGSIRVAFDSNSICMITANSNSGSITLPNKKPILGENPVYTVSFDTNSGDIRTSIY